MKYWIPQNCIKFLDDEEHELLMPVQFNSEGAVFKIKEWSNGWAIEASDDYNCYLSIKHNFQLPIILETEWYQLSVDHIACLSRDRKKHITKLYQRLLDELKDK